MNRQIPVFVFASFLLVSNVLVSAQTMMGSVKGFTEPYHSIDVATSESGTVSEITVEEGQHVKAKTVLARINDEVLQAALIAVQESAGSKGKLNSALAELRMQQQRVERIEGLFARQHASQNELDRARTQLEIAQAQVEAAQDELRVKEKEAKKIEAQIEQRLLRSPIDGIVTRVFREQGEFVPINEPTVLRVVQLDPLKVIFSIPRQQAEQMSAGETVDVEFNSDGEIAQGVVEFVSPTADAQSGTCRVKVRIDNPQHKWASGVECLLKSSSIVGRQKSGQLNIRQSSTSHGASPVPGSQ